MRRGRTCFGDDGDLFFAVGEKEELESVDGGLVSVNSKGFG